MVIHYTYILTKHNIRTRTTAPGNVRLFFFVHFHFFQIHLYEHFYTVRKNEFCTYVRKIVVQSSYNLEMYEEKHRASPCMCTCDSYVQIP